MKLPTLPAMIKLENINTVILGVNTLRTGEKQKTWTSWIHGKHSTAKKKLFDEYEII